MIIGPPPTLAKQGALCTGDCLPFFIDIMLSHLIPPPYHNDKVESQDL